jgi:hypothetical protein
MVKNTGAAGADSVIIDFYINPEEWPTSVDPERLGSGPLAAGDSVNLAITLHASRPETSEVYLVLDPDGLVPEWDENNNTSGPYYLEWSGKGSMAPSITRIKRIYPNPSRSGITVEFDLNTAARAEISIFDPAGRRVRSWITKPLQPETHLLEWDGRGREGYLVSQGVYILHFRAAGAEDSRKIVIIR